MGPCHSHLPHRHSQPTEHGVFHKQECCMTGVADVWQSTTEGSRCTLFQNQHLPNPFSHSVLWNDRPPAGSLLTCLTVACLSILKWMGGPLQVVIFDPYVPLFSFKDFFISSFFAASFSPQALVLFTYHVIARPLSSCKHHRLAQRRIRNLTLGPQI